MERAPAEATPAFPTDSPPEVPANSSHQVPNEWARIPPGDAVPQSSRRLSLETTRWGSGPGGTEINVPCCALPDFWPLESMSIIKWLFYATELWGSYTVMDNLCHIWGHDRLVFHLSSFDIMLKHLCIGRINCSCSSCIILLISV